MGRLIKNIILISLFLLCASFSFASTHQILNTGPIAINTGSTVFFAPHGNPGSSTTENNRQVISSSAGTFTGMRVTLSTAPDTGAGTQSVTITLHIENLDTDLSCTISEAQTTCTDTDNVSVSAGNTVGFEETPSGTPAASNVEITLKFIGTTYNETILSTTSGGLNLSTTDTQYMGWTPGTGLNTTENLENVPMPTGGTLSKFYVETSTAPGTGDSYVFTIYKNGSAPAGGLTCTISGSSATSCSDLSNSITIVAGDTISIESDPSGSPATTVKYRAGVTFTVDNEGEFVMFRDSGSISGTGTSYTGIDSSAINATENVVDQQTNQMSIKALYIKLSADIDNGAGVQTYTFTIRDDANDTAQTCVVSEGVTTTCNYTASRVDVVLDSQMSMSKVPANTPAGVTLAAGILGFITPPRRILVE